MKKIDSILLNISSYFFIVFGVIVTITFLVTLQLVVGDRMQPVLNKNDVVIISKIGYRLFNVRRSDMVSIRGEKEYYINRIVGMPGEKIEYRDNILYINGVGYTEKNINNQNTPNFSIIDFGYEKIPDNTYLVIADNRSKSDVSLILKSDIIGKVILKIWPLNEMKIYN